MNRRGYDSIQEGADAATGCFWLVIVLLIIGTVTVGGCVWQRVEAMQKHAESSK